MASQEWVFISKVIKSGDMQTPTDSRITESYFQEERYRDVWVWVVDFWRQYGNCPSEEAFHREFPSMNFAPVKNESMEHLVAEMRAAFKEKILEEGLTQIVKAFEADDPDQVSLLVSELHQRTAMEINSLRDIDVISTWEQRMKRYRELEELGAGLRGCPTGFDRLDNITFGLQPQQLITMAGLPKAGKSTILMMMAMAAHNFGLKPLFLSFEMSYDEQVTRYDSFLSGIAHKHLMRGSVTKRELSLLEKLLRAKRRQHPFIISEDASSTTTVSAIAAKVEQHRPDVLFVDGVYLLDPEGVRADKGTPQALTQISRDMKRLVQRMKIPAVQTTQALTWKSKGGKVNSLDSIGYTSAFGQDADLIIGAYRHPEIPDQTVLNVIAGRNVPSGVRFGIQWDWEHNNFDEIDYGDEEPGDGQG